MPVPCASASAARPTASKRCAKTQTPSNPGAHRIDFQNRSPRTLPPDHAVNIRNAGFSRTYCAASPFGPPCAARSSTSHLVGPGARGCAIQLDGREGADNLGGAHPVGNAKVRHGRPGDRGEVFASSVDPEKPTAACSHFPAGETLVAICRTTSILDEQGLRSWMTTPAGRGGRQLFLLPLLRTGGSGAAAVECRLGRSEHRRCGGVVRHGELVGPLPNEIIDGTAAGQATGERRRTAAAAATLEVSGVSGVNSITGVGGEGGSGMGGGLGSVSGVGGVGGSGGMGGDGGVGGGGRMPVLRKPHSGLLQPARIDGNAGRLDTEVRVVQRDERMDRAVTARPVAVGLVIACRRGSSSPGLTRPEND